MTLYDTEQWHDLFVATAGAAAALAGLVFVAVSINIERILTMRGVPERGLETVLVLLSSVIVSVLGLVPQRAGSFGIELIVLGAALLAFLMRANRLVLPGMRGHPVWIIGQLAVSTPSSLAFLGGGISLLAGAGGGLAWLATGIVFSLISAVINAWVLLVEILR